jgi:2-oxoisovalerate dehydrogenase E1 component alpha subunit
MMRLRACASSHLSRFAPFKPFRNFSSSAAPPPELQTTPELLTHAPSSQSVLPTFGLLDERGVLRAGAAVPEGLTRELIMRAYRTMVRGFALDTLLYESQRQGRLSFYLTAFGEEAAAVGAAMALSAGDDLYAQYREVGALLWRGEPVAAILDQCLATADDAGKGRMMPVHYGSVAARLQTISSPLATQIPQAAGAAYAHKLRGEDRVVACFFGEGAASEGDFHAGLNIAATVRAPVLFFCRNNGYAISTPASEQYRGDGIAARGVAYGMHTLRCDGNDLFAVFAATRAARALARADGGQPVLVEAMTYRESHHSTSDDSTRYRSADEIAHWREHRNPILRLRRFATAAGWWTDAEDRALLAAEREATLALLIAAEAKPRPPLASMFTDVYDRPTAALREQEAALNAHLRAKDKAS